MLVQSSTPLTCLLKPSHSSRSASGGDGFGSSVDWARCRSWLPWFWRLGNVGAEARAVEHTRPPQPVPGYASLAACFASGGADVAGRHREAAGGHQEAVAELGTSTLLDAKPTTRPGIHPEQHRQRLICTCATRRFRAGFFSWRSTRAARFTSGPLANRARARHAWCSGASPASSHASTVRPLSRGPPRPLSALPRGPPTRPAAARGDADRSSSCISPKRKNLLLL